MNFDPIKLYPFTTEITQNLMRTHTIKLLSLSAFPFSLRGNLHLWQVFFTPFFHLGLPAYFSNRSPFLSEHIFVGFDEFPSLMCKCTVIHHYRPQGPTLFKRVRWDFTCVQCNECTCTRPPRRLRRLQLIPYPKRLQQNKRRESNLCPSASTRSQVQLTTPRVTAPDIKLLSSRYDPPNQANAKNIIKTMSIQITFCARALTN